MRTLLAFLLLPCVLVATTNKAVTGTTAAVPVLYDTDGDKIAQNLNDLMLRNEGPLPVIVVLNEPVSVAALTRRQQSIGSFEVKSTWTVIPGFAASMTPKQISALAQDATVRQIEYDNEVHACLGTAQTWFGTAKARTDWGVDGDRDGNPTSYSKNDIVITILDTGIDKNHYDLDGGKVIAFKDFVNSRTAAYDDHGHGTHCASMAAGSGDGNATYKGVAPGAALVGVKVLNSAGSGSTTTIINGINWVVSNKATYGIRVLSISLGSTGSSNGQDALSLACNSAVDAGIVVCVAAGNSGPARYTISSPAAADKPVTVGCMSDCGEKGYFLAYFSSRGPTADGRTKPEVCAPGWNITAAKKGTTNQYTTMSGTSMSTPFTAGTAALMLDANPSLTPTQIKSYLTSTAQDWGPTSSDVDYGAGRLQGYDAIKIAGGYTGTGPTVPAHVYQSENLGGTGKTDIWQVNVNSTSYPIAVTMIMPSWTSSQDFDLYLYNPSGTKVASSEGTTREEYIGYSPTTTGNYKIYAKSYAGSGSYYIDVSCANAGSITLIQNQFGAEPGGEATMTGEGSPIAACKVTMLDREHAALSYALNRDGKVNLSLWDGSGRIVKAVSVAGHAGRNETQIGISDLARGIYFYRLDANSTSHTGKLTVIK
jgi:serine protease AprX